jgi:hypothetical protein
MARNSVFVVKALRPGSKAGVAKLTAGSGNRAASAAEICTAGATGTSVVPDGGEDKFRGGEIGAAPVISGMSGIAVAGRGSRGVEEGAGTGFVVVGAGAGELATEGTGGVTIGPGDDAQAPSTSTPIPASPRLGNPNSNPGITTPLRSDPGAAARI